MWGRIYYPHVVLLILANTIFKVSCKGNGSLTFLIDDTKSMGDDIDQVRKSVDQIIRIVKHEKSSLIDNMVLVTFNDPGVYDRVVTRDPEEFKKALTLIKPHNEGKPSELDCWEPSMKGLLSALNKSKTDSYIFVFTDAPAKDYIDSHYVIEMCQKKQTQIVFVITGTFCKKKHYVREASDVYFDVAVACSGLAIFVKKDEVEKMFGPIAEIIKGNKAVIATATVRAGVSKNIPFTTDDHTDYVIVSASGKNVKLKIKPSVAVTKIMSTDNAIVVKFSNTKPGNYVATVKGKTKTSVVITGRTDFFFSHGFSKLRPKSLSDTSPQPKSDAKGYLSISVTDDNHSVRIEAAKIIDMEGKPIIEKLPLTEISENFYITRPFVAPPQMFKVAVEGFVKATNKTIKRTAKIPVSPPPPKIAPKVKGVRVIKVTKGKTAVLKCKIIKGEPKPTITWQFMDNFGSNSQIVGSKNVLHISRVDNKHAGRYKCVAKNKVGSDEHITTLEVQDHPKIVTSVSNTYESTEGDALLRIPCVAVGLPKPSITWKLNGLVIYPSARYSIENGTLIIRDPKLSDTNSSYTCEAKNKVGAVSATFRTYIRQVPQVSGVTNKAVRIGTPASIECTIIKGEPKPTITWQFMDNFGSNSQIVGSNNVLHISRVDNKHAGRYKCVAKNKVGSDEQVTTLIIESLPEITTNSTIVEGIEGDLALRIPCDVVGIPQPVVTWKINVTKITPDGKYSIEDGALVIVKPAKNDSSLYTCEAKNNVGSVSTTFQIAVEKHLKTFGTKHNVYLLQGETRELKCEAYSSESQSVKWFEANANPRSPHSSLSTTKSPPVLDSSETTTVSSKDYYYSSTTTSPTIMLNENITKPYRRIVNASYFDDGNYTCRVSDKHGNTHTHTYVVSVGSAPEFLRADANSLSDWRGVISDIIDNCDIQPNAKPKPIIEWTFNGKVLTDFNSAGLGHYTCNVSNVHGSVQKRFDVKSSVCLITRNLRDAQYMPLLLNDNGFWHKFTTTNHYIVVQQEEKITLSCPNQKETSNKFKMFPNKSTLEAFCYKKDSFKVEGNIYKLSDLQCTNSIQPSVIRKKVKCSTETSELIRVGYNVSGFLEAYEVCFDTEKNMPLYTRIIMTETNNDGLSAGYNWYTFPGVGIKKTERGFTCNDTTSSCCYSKSQLVNAKDFNDGPAKRSTFIDPLNVVPVWLPCTSKPTWETVNDKVISMLPNYQEIVTWSGTHTFQDINGTITPRYLWKVVWYDGKDAVAIVHVNDPSPTEKDIKCKDICTENNTKDWLEFDDKYTYCCSLQDFFETFNIHNIDIGESLDAALVEMKKKI